MFGRSWVRFLSGTQIFSLFNDFVMLISSLFTFHYWAYNLPSLFFYQQDICYERSKQNLDAKDLVFACICCCCCCCCSCVCCKHNMDNKKTSKQEIENNTWLPVDKEFLFSNSTWYCTRSLRSLVRYQIMTLILVASQQQAKRATVVYKSLHGLAPDFLCSTFERRETA